MTTDLPEAVPEKVQDEFMWLEGLRNEKALAWAHEQNSITLSAFTQGDDFELIREKVLQGLNSPDQIPGVWKCGHDWYNFWQDAKNPKGLLRKTTLDEFRKAEPRWETVLDVDALGKAENIEWVFSGFWNLKPGFERAFVVLSPDGGDACEVREFDLKTKEFVAGGFYLPVAKSRISWIDFDHMFVATDFGEGSMTDSGYPRIVKIWQRGTPLSEAVTVYSAGQKDMMAAGYQEVGEHDKRNYVVRVIDFYHREVFLVDDVHALIKIDIPADAKFTTWREWILIEPSSDWQVNGQVWPSGSLLTMNFDAFIAGERTLKSLFVPDTGSALSGVTKTRDQLNGFSHTRDHIILSLTRDVVNRLEVLTPKSGEWLREPFGHVPELSKISAWGVDDKTNDYFMSVSGFLQPASLSLGNLDNGADAEAELLKQDPPHFDASRYQVSQHFAQSDDGTRVPYFVVSRKDVVYDGKNPTLLYGYGGFEVSLEPYYLGVSGVSWMDRGGVFVVANIRGGGEYGPEWHKAALKEKRLRAYEDFSAVAKALIASKMTSPAHLAAQGGSNGGLLVGNMLTRYPELFGAIVCEVPLLDMYRYTQISAGASWIAEYGDPQKPEEWAYIRAFSPYHNIDPQKKYPPVLFSTATSDDRVGPDHARKMAAKMQALGIPDVYFYENTEGGHSAAADKTQSAFKRALVSEFLLHFIGRKP
ncbi:prolyl oligopeptidase family serine peptidase [Rahnella sp. PCH160]|uniref:prolyl oligopeptidase family serine peptidase n=1 Tax=Rahnella sp. PCH160 TaxID=3447928 RepID=UPI0039FC8495